MAELLMSITVVAIFMLPVFFFITWAVEYDFPPREADIIWRCLWGVGLVMCTLWFAAFHL